MQTPDTPSDSEVATPDQFIAAIHLATPSGEWVAVKHHPNRDEQERTVTVCDKCLQASCWQCIFMCDDARYAGTVNLPISKLRELGREHSSYWETSDAF